MEPTTMTLQLTDFAVIGGMLTFFTTMMLAVLHSTAKAITRSIAVVEGRVTVVEGRIATFEEKKVDKKDWLRVEFSTRQKVDAVGEKVTSLNARLEADWGMAAAVNRLADGVSKMASRNTTETPHAH